MMEDLSFMDVLIAFLTSARSSTIYRRNLYRMAQEKSVSFNKQRVQQCLYRLKTKGVVKFNRECVYVSTKQLSKFGNNRLQIDRKSKPGKSERILVFYDIPESMRFARRLIREQLKFWEYRMLQQSVWFGNGPLPSGFKNQLQKWGVTNQVKILSLKKK